MAENREGIEAIARNLRLLAARIEAKAVICEMTIEAGQEEAPVNVTLPSYEWVVYRPTGRFEMNLTWTEIPSDLAKAKP